MTPSVAAPGDTNPSDATDQANIVGKMRYVLIYKDLKTDENNLPQLTITADFCKTQIRSTCANYPSL